MDEKLNAQEMTVEEFMKPRCPVKVGDYFYKKYHVPSTLNKIRVEEIQEAKDDDGYYYIITGKYINTAIGQNVYKFSSRMVEDPERYVIEKKGVDF